MSRLLADTLSILNGFVALVIIAVCVFAGGVMIPASPGVGMVAGAIVGIIVAALLCGIVAYLVLIERHLAQLARARE